MRLRLVSARVGFVDFALGAVGPGLGVGCRLLCVLDRLLRLLLRALGPGETILATWDRDLSNVAVDAGLAVAPAL